MADRRIVWRACAAEGQTKQEVGRASECLCVCGCVNLGGISGYSIHLTWRGRSCLPRGVWLWARRKEGWVGMVSWSVSIQWSCYNRICRLRLRLGLLRRELHPRHKRPLHSVPVVIKQKEIKNPLTRQHPAENMYKFPPRLHRALVSDAFLFETNPCRSAPHYS